MPAPKKLNAFFRPKSVALIGASSDPSKLGYAVMRNLVECGYSRFGKIYPINPKAGEILGEEAFPSVLEVKEPIELGVIVIPAKYVADALRECGEKGIKACIVISAGFREAGPEGVEREHEIIRIAKQYGMRLIGPNVLGVVDTFTPLNASFAADTPPKGPMAFSSQSGALGAAILDWALGGNMGLSKFVSLGNKADVTELDLLEEWKDDDESRVILLYSEELTDGQKFMQIAREVSKVKPIVAIKSGTTQAGARAVSSHTGSLAGSEQAYRAAFRQAGVIRADSMQELFDMALAFGFQPPLAGKQIAVITNAGGPGILATDALEHYGLQLAHLEPSTIQALAQTLPPAASPNNPVDVLGDAHADRYQAALELVAADPHVDGMLVVLTPQAMTEIEATADVVAAAAKKLNKPVLACFMGALRVQPGIDKLMNAGIPNYPFPNRAAQAFWAMAQYHEICQQPEPEYAHFDIDRAAVQAAIDKARSEGRLSIGDAESRAILQACGLRIPRAEIAPTADRAVELAGQIGYPVVLKIASPDILHKTDVGGVKIGLQSDEEVRDAFELMMYRVQRYLPEARLWGCLVQEMLSGDNLEVLIGMNRDPQFGPLVTFGLGGIYVETLKDVTFRIAPFSKRDAEDMLAEIRTSALLDGVRGQPPADKPAIADALLRIGQLVQDFPEIVELDINPLVVFSKSNGAMAIDMRLVLDGSQATGAPK